MEIKIYEDKYRDDMISMVLQAKAALGRPSSLNEDLLDIKANYFQRDRTRQRGESLSIRIGIDPDRRPYYRRAQGDHSSFSLLFMFFTSGSMIKPIKTPDLI